MKNISSLTEIENKGLCIIKFYSYWCGPCKQMEVFFGDLEKENPNVHFYNSDISEASNFATEMNIINVPTLIYIKDGQEINRTIGFKSKNNIQDEINGIKNED